MLGNQFIAHSGRLIMLLLASNDFILNLANGCVKDRRNVHCYNDLEIRTEDKIRPWLIQRAWNCVTKDVSKGILHTYELDVHRALHVENLRSM